MLLNTPSTALLCLFRTLETQENLLCGSSHVNARGWGMSSLCYWIVYTYPSAIQFHTICMFHCLMAEGQKSKVIKPAFCNSKTSLHSTIKATSSEQWTHFPSYLKPHYPLAHVEGVQTGIPPHLYPIEGEPSLVRPLEVISWQAKCLNTKVQAGKRKKFRRPI